MIRKITTIALGLIAASALLLAVAPAQEAQAQSCAAYNACIVYPDSGFFVAQSTPVPTASPGPTSAAVVSADTIGATAGGAGGSGQASIAFTGAESRVLGYAGAGLIGLGGVALVVARRRTNSDLD